MKALITGGNGFLGAHLAHLLAARGDEVVATFRGTPASPRGAPSLDRAQWIQLDITNETHVTEVVRSVQPDAIFHFAGMPYVRPSWLDPSATFRTNLLGTLHLLEAMRREAPGAKLAFAGSGTEYGAPDQVPTPESAPLRPSSPYASSKAAADLLCYQYHASHGIRTYRLRIFGTTGPGKVGDACNDFASQIAAVEREAPPRTVRVGFLDTRRDITDVRDTVRAFVSVIERGAPGEAYNVGCGQAYSMRAILDELLQLSRNPCQVEEAPDRMRRVDEPVHLADVTRLRALGWTSEISISTTLRDILAAWRAAPTATGPVTS